jgi:Mg-dependent DNase
MNNIICILLIGVVITASSSSTSSTSSSITTSAASISTATSSAAITIPSTLFATTITTINTSALFSRLTRPSISPFLLRRGVNNLNLQYSNRKETRLHHSNTVNNRRSSRSRSGGRRMFVDIGANLLDDMYQGCYRGKQRHEKDLDAVLQRAWDNQLDQIIVTAGTIHESEHALTLTQRDDRLYCTAGVHPTRCSQVFGTTQDSWEESLEQLKHVIKQGLQQHKVVALGELGLDYARLEFCDAETQKKGLIAQLKLARDHSFHHLPLFLHNRESGNDLLQILKQHYIGSDADATTGGRGVVHSFDDSLELAHEFMKLGFYIGINGCSLKTQDNLDVVQHIPLERILLETDCPWCDIRPTHAGWEHVRTKFDVKTEKKYDRDYCVKGRNEPCHIVQVAEVIAGIKGVSVEEVATVSRQNAQDLFFGMVTGVKK